MSEDWQKTGMTQVEEPGQAVIMRARVEKERKKAGGDG